MFLTLRGRTGLVVHTDEDALRLRWRPSEGESDAQILGATSLRVLSAGGGDLCRQRVNASAPGALDLPAALLPALSYWQAATSPAAPILISRPPLLEKSWIGCGDEAAEGGSVRFFTDFSLTGDADAVLLHLGACGITDVKVNDVRCDSVLSPPITDTRRELAAVGIDLTPLVSAGHNRLEIEIASGPSRVRRLADRYTKLTFDAGPPRLSAVVTAYRDGRAQTVADTQAGWLWTRGFTTTAHWYGGEHYTGRMTPTVAHDAVNVTETRPLWWAEQPPTLIHESREPVRVTRVDARRAVFDMGANVAAQPRISGGDWTGRLWPGELLDETGWVSQESTGSPIFHDVELAPGSSGWSSAYVFNGFRYVGVELTDDRSSLPALSADVVRVANDAVSTLNTPHHFVRRMHEMVTQAIRGNMHSVFTDCPHREKLGWLEQLHFCFDAVARNYDVEAHMRDMLHHIRGAQHANGAIPNIAPELVDFTGHAWRGDPNAFREDPNWGSAIARTSWKHYQHYGDEQVLLDNLDAIRRYLHYLSSREVNGLLDFGLGDWVSLDSETSRVLVASHGYVQTLQAASSIEDVLGNEKEAARLVRKSKAVSRATLLALPLEHARTQGELALIHDLSSPQLQPRVFEALRSRIDADGGARVGEVSLPALFRAFETHQRTAELLDILARPDIPGYGWLARSGASALPETWTGTGGAEAEGSQNHFMLGAIEEWFHTQIVGIRQMAGDIGWRSVTFAPSMIDAVESASATFMSPSGRYALAWDARTGTVEAEVPGGGTARLIVPGGWDAGGKRLLHAGIHSITLNRQSR